MILTPWAMAWRDEPDDAVLDEIVEVRAKPIASRGLDAYHLAQTFATAAAEIFLCDPQGRDLIRRFLSIGRQHVMTNHPSLAWFDERVSTIAPWLNRDAPAYCLTGEAGIGKSALELAFERLIKRRIGKTDTVELADVPITPLWSATVREAGSVSDVLEQLTEGASRPETKTARRVLRKLLKKLRVRSYRDGVGMLRVDELQFGTKGAANAWITGLLLMLISIGPALLYACNFSLLNKLAMRPQEDQRRLLSNLIVMRPFGEVGPDWIRFVDEIMRLLPEVWGFTAREVAADVLRWTFGIRDNGVHLFKEAILFARATNPDAKVTKDHLELAYLSVGYAARRKDVEILLGGRAMAGKRLDLFSPLWMSKASGLGGPPTDATRVTASSDPKATKVTEARTAIESARRRTLDAMHLEQLPKSQRAELEKRSRSGSGRAQVVPIGKRSKRRTFDEILADAAENVHDL